MSFSITEQFHAEDLRRFESDNRWLENFLIVNENNVNKAAQQFYETLKWRKSFGANGEVEN